MSAQMPPGLAASAGGDCPCCRSVDVVPPLRAPLAIRARGEDGYARWFAGTFDGRCWWSPERPAGGGHWAVVGWRALEGHAPERMPPCQRSSRHGPRLFRGSGGALHAPPPSARAPQPAALRGAWGAYTTTAPPEMVSNAPEV